jgi:tRNA A37 methylthiotransferase MiaB
MRKSRASQLADLTRQLKLKRMQPMLNQTVSVLWESEKYQASEEKTLNLGYTPNYVRVAIDSQQSGSELSNSIHSVKLTKISSNNDFVWAQPVYTLRK